MTASNAGTMDETSDLTHRAQNKETRIRFGDNRRRKTIGRGKRGELAPRAEPESAKVQKVQSKNI